MSGASAGGVMFASYVALAERRELLLAAFCAGLARWEAFENRDRGEVCVSGFRYSTRLDADGCPIVTSAIEHELRAALNSSRVLS